MSRVSFNRKRVKLKKVLGIRARLALLALILVTPLMLERVRSLEDTRSKQIALASSEQLAEIVRRAGAIYWANSIANTVRAADAAAFDAALGESLCVVGLANRDLSGPMQPLTPYDQLGRRVTEDGLRCLGAWCKAQGPGIGLRVRLKLAANPALDDAVESPFDEFGPAIIRRTVG